MLYVQIGIYDIFLDGTNHFIHKLFIHLIHLHLIRREERTLGECFAFFLTVIQQGYDLRFEVVERERFLYIGFRTYLQAVDLAVDIILGCQEDDGNMAQVHIRLYLLTQLPPVHNGHHDIADDQINPSAPQHFQCFLSIFCRFHRKNLQQAFGHKFQHGLIIFYQQQNVTFHFRLYRHPFTQGICLDRYLFQLGQRPQGIFDQRNRKNERIIFML